jgi:SNF2 family DNA or RNA helicase
MSMLHGSWISKNNSFFLWGERWRSLVNLELDNTKTEVVINPFCLAATELIALLQEHNLKLESTTQNLIITIPSLQASKTKPIVPIVSQNLASLDSTDIKKLKLHQWQVTGLSLTPQAAIKLFTQLPLNQTEYLAPELVFWTHLYRWCLDLIVKGKFISGINQTEDKIQGIWQPLLDSEIERIRLAKFSQIMPDACLSFNNQIQKQELLLDFLTKIIDAQVREWSDYTLSTAKNITITPWLRSLFSLDNIINTDSKNRQRLTNAIYNWQLPLQEYIVSENNHNLAQNRYRLALVLEPPIQAAEKSVQGNWQLKYCLQALDDTDLIIEAETIWNCSNDTLEYQQRSIENAQEILLKGLGLATRLYEPITNSLNETNPVSCQLNPIEVYQFIRSTAWQLQNNGLGVILPPGLASGENEQRLGIKITAEVAQTKTKNTRLSLQSLLQYQLQIAVGDTTLSKANFEKLLAQQSPIVEVDGKWLALQPADVKAAQAILDRSQTELNLSVEDALRIATGDTKTLAKLPVVKFAATGILGELIDNLTDRKSVEPITEIKDLNGILRPYQARGVGWLSFLEKWSLGACLADDMGLGKTLQLIAFVLNLHHQKKLNKSILVVCPTSVLNNWEREIQKFAPTLSTIIHHGEQRNQGKTFVKEVANKQLVITSYSLVYRDLKTLQQIDWEGIVLDEAQNIKNSTAKQAQAVREISAGFRIALTGTPVENRLSELWSILDFLNPGFLGTKSFFQKRFALPIEKYGDRESLNILRSLVRPFILRRLKTDQTIIQDLPEKQEMNVFCGLTTEQADIYQQLVDSSMTAIESAEGIQRHGLILTLLMRLKQLCNHPDLTDSKKQKITKLSADFGNRSGKLMRLSEMLEEVLEEEDRALIFTQFSEWGKLLKLYLESTLKTEVLFLYGATKRNQRQEIIDRFQNDPNAPKLFILSLKAGGTGLNLTRANHVFHVDRWWNPAVENQATDRAFRIGQKRNVQVHKFVCSGTLEEKINDIIESKKELAEQTVDAGEQWLTRLDTDRFRSLLLLDRDRIIEETD